MPEDVSDRFRVARNVMVETQLRQRGIRDERVLSAMETVPRHEFIDPGYWGDAYADHPLPIASGQTVSQPYIVAAMVEALALRAEDKVLEVGTGTGYEAAVLARIAGQVYTIERHTGLARQANEILSRLGYKNVVVAVGDGSKGLPEQAPFDAIIVAAAAVRIPDALVAQLAEGGNMVIPVGPPDVQTLQLVRKLHGEPRITQLDACRFVPLIDETRFFES
ncbi:MAG TPA: protein-L-isoaspartate(D-aspartate) O-methyltransferase [Clostridia bacterium]|nr:protein-L-isoaspartate(D-aspartate) O-methyltransferase [Clostridia bacterium]